MIKYKLFKDKKCISTSYSTNCNDFGEELRPIEEKIKKDIKFFKNSTNTADTVKVYIDNEFYKEVIL